MTLQAMLHEMVRTGGERPALLGHQGAVSFERLEREQDWLAGFLMSRGLHNGDRVAVLVGRRCEMVVSLLGVTRAGGIMVPVNFRLSQSLLAPMMAEAAPRFAIVESDLGRQVVSDPDRWGLGTVQEFVVVGGGGGVAWSEALQSGRETALPPPPDEGTPVYLAYTSGTTGAPRAAVISQQNVFWNARGVREVLGLGPEDVHLLTFPSYMQPHELISRTLVCGGPTVLLESLRPRAIGRALDEFGVTSLVTVPRLARRLLPLLAEVGKPGRLRMVVLSSETPSRALFAALVRHGLDVYSSWGSAETAGMALCGRGPATVGRPSPYYEIAISGEGETGEMRVGGPGVSREYYGEVGDRRKDLSAGWFQTGDLVRREADGGVHLEGRVRALVEVGRGSVDMGALERRLRSRTEFEAVLVRRGLKGPSLAVYVVPNRFEFDEDEARTVVGEELASVWKGPLPTPSAEELLCHVRFSVASALPETSALGGRAELLEVEEMMEEVDRRMVALVNERARHAGRLREIRARGDLPPFDPGRDEEMLQAALGANTGPLYDQALEQILRMIQEQTFLSE